MLSQTFNAWNDEINNDNWEWKFWKYALLEIIEAALVHFNIVNNYYEQDSRILSMFVSNTLFCQLLDTLSKYFIFFKTFNSEFSYIEIRFTDQNSRPLEIQD